MTVRFGVNGSGQQPTGMPPAAYFGRIAELAEALGYDSLWVGDHISFHNPILESLVTLGYFAGRTERIGLGTAVYLLPLRHPSFVAKQVASLDVLSAGRVLFGIGVGGEGEKDFEAVEVPKERRGARTNEAIEVLRVLWTQSPASFKGEFFGFEDISIEPRPDRSIPIWVGGRAERALQRVGRQCDGWLALFQSPQGFARSLASIRSYAEQAGRDPDGITPALMLPLIVDDDSDRAAQRVQDHLSARYGQPFERHVIDRYCLAGPVRACVDRIQEYVEAGVRHFVLNPTAEPDEQEEQLHRLAEGVVAPFRA